VVAELLDELGRAGADEQVTVPDYTPPLAPLDSPIGIASLLAALREVGSEQAKALVDRMPAMGPFAIFCEHHEDVSWFGREPNESLPHHGTGTTWTDRSAA